jgi:hypothetical protein
MLTFGFIKSVFTKYLPQFLFNNLFGSLRKPSLNDSFIDSCIVTLSAKEEALSRYVSSEQLSVVIFGSAT